MLFLLACTLLLTLAGGVALAQDEKTVVIGLSAEPATLDFRNYQLNASTFAVVWQMYEPLVQHDTRTDELIPGLAESWEQIDEDSYQFNLRQDVAWHDGEPFTADDVIWSFTRTENRRLQYGLAAENPIEKIDDHTIIINTDGPRGPFLKQDLALNMRVLPEHIFEPLYTEARNATYEPTKDANGNDLTAEQVKQNTLMSIDRGEAWTEAPFIGTGPFKFENWERGSEIVLVANDDYWGGRPNVDRLVFRWVEDDNSRVIGLESGDFDVIINVPQQEVERLQGLENVGVVVSPGIGYAMLTMNQSVPALADVRVRQAIAYAIDKDEIVSLYPETATRTCGPLSVLSSYYNANVNCFDYNPDRARELLTEAGWDSNTHIQLKISANLADEALLIQQYLGDVGITVDILEVDAASYYAEVRGGESELALYGFTNVVDPDHIFWVFTTTPGLGGPIFSYENSHVNELLQQGQKTSDPDARRAIYDEAQQIIVDEDTVAVFLYSASVLRGYRTDRVTGIEPMPLPTDIYFWFKMMDTVS
jgi:peptide/nickel transport system substrate-binding protein